MENRYGERIENERKEFIENVRKGYEVANNLWIMSDQNYWAIFNALLVANTILLTGIGWFFSKEPNCDSNDKFLTYLSSIIIPIVGLLVCIIWFFISHRRSTYCQYNMFSARKLEEYLIPLTTMTNGGELSKGKEVVFNFKNGDIKTVKIKFLPKINVAWFSYVVISLFALIYLIIFFSKGLTSIKKNSISIHYYGGIAMDLYAKIVLAFALFGALILGIVMISVSMSKLYKSDIELESKNSKFIALLGTIITIISILLCYFALNG